MWSATSVRSRTARRSPARQRLDADHAERFGPGDRVEETGRAREEVVLVCAADLADVLNRTIEQRAMCSWTYARSAGSGILAAIRNGRPAVLADRAARCTPLSGLIRPRNSASPPARLPCGRASTSTPWWITAAIGMPTASRRGAGTWRSFPPTSRWRGGGRRAHYRTDRDRSSRRELRIGPRPRGRSGCGRARRRHPSRAPPRTR